MIKTIFHFILIKWSGLFDCSYYLQMYEDVRKSEVNPVIHFIKYGWKEHRNPSASFDTGYYLDKYQDVQESKQNPLIHYIRFGKKEGRSIIKKNNKQGIPTEQKAKNHLIIDGSILKNINKIATTNKTDIIILVGPNPDSFIKCYASIKEHTKNENYNLNLVIHEADFPKIKNIISPYVNVFAHTMEFFNFSKANNIALKVAENDVILLNDDTQVTEGWLEKLRKDSRGFALTGAHTGHSCSGNPHMWGEGPARLTDMPINMFCAFIPQRLMAVIGFLDDVFSYYGGEDVDYSIRALKNGFPLIISEAFVQHEKNISYGGFKENLMRESSKVLYDKQEIGAPYNLGEVTPRISIIVAAKQPGDNFIKNLRTILDDNYRNKELILLTNDPSFLRYQAGIVDIQKEYRNTKVVLLTGDLNPAKVRRVGLNMSSGQFITFINNYHDIPTNLEDFIHHFILHPRLDTVFTTSNNTSLSELKSKINNRTINENDQSKLIEEINSIVLFGRRKVFLTLPFLSFFGRAMNLDWLLRADRENIKISVLPQTKNFRYPLKKLKTDDKTRLDLNRIIEREKLIESFKRN